MLMVGTLQCRSDNRWAIERYNEFVTKQRGLLDANAYVLKAHFMRENGIQDGQAAYDRFATTLANQKGARAADPGFCPTIDTFVRMATDANQADLLVLASSVSDAPVSGPCTPSNYVADASPVSGKDAAAPATAAPETAITAAPDATAGDEPAATAAAASTHTEDKTAAPPSGPAEVKAVAQQSSTDQPAATPATSAATRDEALKAAIVALQSATAALQAATAPASTKETDTAKKPPSTLVKVVDAPVVPPQEESTKSDE